MGRICLLSDITAITLGSSGKGNDRMPPKKNPQRRKNLSVRLTLEMIRDLRIRAANCDMKIQKYIEAALTYDIENKVVQKKETA